MVRQRLTVMDDLTGSSGPDSAWHTHLSSTRAARAAQMDSTPFWKQSPVRAGGGRQREPGDSGVRPGWNPPHHTGRSSNVTLETTGAWGEERQVQQLPTVTREEWQWRGRALSALWFGAGRAWGGARPSFCLSALPPPRRAQSFQSFLMVRFHSQDRWSVLSSSVKRDLML